MLVSRVYPLLIWISASVVNADALVLSDLGFVDLDIDDLTGFDFLELVSIIKEEESLIMLIRIPLKPQGLAIA
jgi:hypothetical protein